MQFTKATLGIALSRVFSRASDARIAARLEQTAGQHLVMVRYTENHDPDAEWVYNRADIDGSKVVWARDMDPAENRELLQYFHDRRAWLVEADEMPPKVAPYP